MSKPYQYEIDKMIAELTGLRNRRIVTSVRSQEDELDSYADARKMALDAQEIVAAGLIGLCEIAIECAGLKLGRSEREEAAIRGSFRDPHLIHDALYDADEWAEEYAVEEHSSTEAA